MTGNSLDNRIKGNSSANILRGRGGSDEIEAGDGDDELFGGASSDPLIPTSIGYDPCAHSLIPLVRIFHGRSMSLFQASQHRATMSSYDPEDSVREPVFADELPDVLDPVQFRCP